mmetsp:Transcript_22783/g.52207  ORF Transcript_22783/g.52207 Transcript_22783/m.52207 type:complete len:213 (-) Transcript_22783:22-660(-)
MPLYHLHLLPGVLAPRGRHRSQKLQPHEAGKVTHPPLLHLPEAPSGESGGGTGRGGVLAAASYFGGHSALALPVCVVGAGAGFFPPCGPLFSQRRHRGDGATDFLPFLHEVIQVRHVFGIVFLTMMYVPSHFLTPYELCDPQRHFRRKTGGLRGPNGEVYLRFPHLLRHHARRVHHRQRIGTVGHRSAPPSRVVRPFSPSRWQQRASLVQLP